MKREHLYILLAVVFLATIVIIYYFYTKKQTELAQKQLELQQAEGGNKVNLFDTVQAIGTGLGIFGTKTPATATA